MKAIIMAAGKGTRLYDAENPMPKVLRTVNGRPVLSYVFDACENIEKKDTTVIVGFMHEMVEDYLKDTEYKTVIQGSDGYGTGYAVMCALASDELKDYDGDIIVLSGDTPTVKKSTVENMIAQHKAQGNACTLLAVNDEKNASYGKIIRKDGNISEIIEVKDCTEEQLKITELNAGLYVYDAKLLKEALKSVDCNNKAHEYYLTDAPKLLIKAGHKVDSYITDDISETFGINTFEELKRAEQIINDRKAK